MTSFHEFNFHSEWHFSPLFDTNTNARIPLCQNRFFKALTFPCSNSRAPLPNWQSWTANSMSLGSNLKLHHRRFMGNFCRWSHPNQPALVLVIGRRTHRNRQTLKSQGGLGKSASWWNFASRSQYQLCLLAADSMPKTHVFCLTDISWPWPIFCVANGLWHNHVEWNLFITRAKMVDVGRNIGYPPIPIYKHQKITFEGPDGSPDFGASLFASWIVGLLPHPPLFTEIL